MSAGIPEASFIWREVQKNYLNFLQKTDTKG